MKYEGRSYDVDVPQLGVTQCGACGERLFDIDADARINAALRAKLGLLQPGQIRDGRTTLGLTQKQFAAHLGVAEESICRWESGAHIQSRSVDRLIRLYFESRRVRQLLGSAPDAPQFGQTVEA